MHQLVANLIVDFNFIKIIISLGENAHINSYLNHFN
jgi:hypothetical protein